MHFLVIPKKPIPRISQAEEEDQQVGRIRLEFDWGKSWIQLEGLLLVNKATCLPPLFP